ICAPAHLRDDLQRQPCQFRATNHPLSAPRCRGGIRPSAREVQGRQRGTRNRNPANVDRGKGTRQVANRRVPKYQNLRGASRSPSRSPSRKLAVKASARHQPTAVTIVGDEEEMPRFGGCGSHETSQYLADECNGDLSPIAGECRFRCSRLIGRRGFEGFSDRNLEYCHLQELEGPRMPPLPIACSQDSVSAQAGFLLKKRQ